MSNAYRRVGDTSVRNVTDLGNVLNARIVREVDMEPGTFLRELVTKLEPNATIVAIEEHGGDRYRVRLAGTTGVVADCELPRADVEAAERRDDARRRITTALKRCADDVVAPVPDGRA